MSTKRKPEEMQSQIPDRLMPLDITTAALTNPRTGKPTAVCSLILADIDRLISWFARNRRDIASIRLTAGQLALLRDNHRECPHPNEFQPGEPYRLAHAEFRARPVFYCGVQLVASHDA